MLARLLSIIRTSFLVALGIGMIVLFSGVVLSNQQMVTIAFWEWTLGPMHLSQALFLSFFTGTTLSILLGCFMVTRLVIENRRLRKKLAMSQQELKQLRVGALRGITP